jgi:hypothetical protein
LAFGDERPVLRAHRVGGDAGAVDVVSDHQLTRALVAGVDRAAQPLHGIGIAAVDAENGERDRVCAIGGLTQGGERILFVRSSDAEAFLVDAADDVERLARLIFVGDEGGRLERFGVVACLPGAIVKRGGSGVGMDSARAITTRRGILNSRRTEGTRPLARGSATAEGGMMVSHAARGVL